MHWYSKEMFEEYFRLVEYFRNKSILRILPSGKRDFTIDDAGWYIEHLRDFYKRMHRCEYVKNIKIFPSIRDCIMSLEESNEWIESKVRPRIVEAISGHLNDGDGSYAYRWISTRFSPEASYFYKLSRELYDYLYIDRYSENDKKKAFKKMLSEFLSLGSQIKSFIEDDKIFKEVRTHYFSGGNRFGNASDYLTSIVVEKNSLILAEKIFVMNLIRVHRRFFRSPKLNKIQEIMCLPFFKRQLDTSTLNRINRKMQEQEAARLEAKKAMADSRP